LVVEEGEGISLDGPFILPFSVEPSLDDAGGKGLNLSRLYRAGFPVPPGFIVSTAAYEAFVRAHNLDARISGELATLSATDPSEATSLEAASRAIRAAFRAHPLPTDVAVALRRAYRELNRSVVPGQPSRSTAVAVRSSATAEDLPGFSFAGQQDTYLNIIGESALQDAVVECWSSLWTARAIGYRARNGIAHADVSLAVVVQAMVPSETSGVLFTANPLTGKRTEMVIDATFGLGEALVSGQVEPDHYVVDADGQVVVRTVGEKAIAIHGREGGGTFMVTQDLAAHPALSDAAVLELTQVGRRVADLFGAPQDIEWARADGQLYLLQSRPITTLYPLPEGMPREPLRVLFSLASVQGVLDPITPLGRDTLIAALAGLGDLVGVHLTLARQTLLREAGERLWIDFTGLVRSRPGRRLLLAGLSAVDSAASRALALRIDQERFPDPHPLRPRTVLRLLPRFLPIALRMIPTILRPETERERLLQQLDALIDDWEAQFAGTTELSERVELARRATNRIFQYVLPRFIPRFGIGMGAYNLLNRLAAALPQGAADPRLIMRSVPGNVTTEMDLALWETAQRIRADLESRNRFQRDEATTLVDQYKAGDLPETAQVAVARFMTRYGMRGWVEIDVGRRRWREDPQPLFRTLLSYLEMDIRDQAPDLLYQRGKQLADAEVDRLVAALRHTRGGRVKAWVARVAAHRMRALLGLREAPKFTVVRLFGIIREALLADGARLAAEGVLRRPEDLFFLRLDEVSALASGERRDWAGLVRARRQAFEQERRRAQVPRLLFSDGEAVYAGVAASDGDDDTIIRGDPVSPGVVEGLVRVVRDPQAADLAVGEILVCPGTDPSWTPLFLVAGGLVMEVGGMMTHGAVVAREYGLPAVVGVHQATTRLQTGERVRVNGSTGQVFVLPD
jgi:pyruvate,water dikinase